MNISVASDELPLIWEHNRRAGDEIVACVTDRVFCALLGPRYAGKTDLLHHVAFLLGSSPRLCIYINLFDVQSPTQMGFFARLIGIISETILERSEHELTIPSGEPSSTAFPSFLNQTVEQLRDDLVLIFDHLEGLPTDLLNALLSALRTVYIEQQDQDQRVIAIVSGALSWASLTVGDTSPFHGIARRVMIGDLTESESEAMISTSLQPAGLQLSPSALSSLLAVAHGNPHLIKQICSRSLAIASEYPSKRLGFQTVTRAVREFIQQEAPSYGLIQEAIRLIEKDPDLLECILRLLERGTVPIRELNLPVHPDPDKLYLTGLVERVGGESYRIRNKIYRDYLREYFDPGRVGYLLTVAGRWDSAIGHLEISVRSGNDQYWSDLLGATINSMYASENVLQAAYYLSRGLSAAFGITDAFIWLLLRETNSLKLAHQLGATTDGVLPVVPQEIPLDADRIETRSYRQASIIREYQDAYCTKYVIPLLVTGHPPMGVVTVCESLENLAPSDQRKQELQLESYLNQAAHAFHEVDTRHRRESHFHAMDAQLERKTHQMLLLHRVSTLAQTLIDLKKTCHLILTTITAHFGLGFNRAWLFLLDPLTNHLMGRMGIGCFTHDEAYRAWEHSAQLSFDEYVVNLSHDQIEESEFDHFTQQLMLPISEKSDDLFSRAILKRHLFHWVGDSSEWHALPHEFRQRFEPDELILIPLVAQNDCLGLIAVDNKFRPRPFTDIDELMLKTFANQMATAVLNALQRQKEESRLKLQETLREISLIIASSLELKEVLRRILKEMRKVLPFDTASIQLLAENEQCLKIIASTGFEVPEEVEKLAFALSGDFPNVQVWKQKQSLRYADVREQFPHFKNPVYHGTHVRGWLGAPLLKGDEVVGVITLDSETPSMYTADHDQLAFLFASQATVAIENARAYEMERNTREFLDRLIDSSQDGIIAVDNDGWVIHFNEGAERILGYSADEVLRRQKRVDEFYTDIAIAREIKQRLIANERVKNLETRIHHKDGQEIPIVLSATLLRSKDGGIMGSVGFFKDLRPLRRAENNLRMILDTISTLSILDNTEAALTTLAEKLVTALPVTFCHIMLLDESKQNFITKAAFPIPRAESGIVKWEPGAGKSSALSRNKLLRYFLTLHAPRVFRQGETTDGVDVVAHVQDFTKLQEPLHSILIIPLEVSNEMLGICTLGEVRNWSRNPFENEKIELISSMITQGAVFVDRSQAHESTRNKLMMVERLNSIGEELVKTSPVSTKSILDKVAQAACDVLSAASAVIYPWSRQEKSYDINTIAYSGLSQKKLFSDKTRDDEGSMTGIVVKKGIVIVDDIQNRRDRTGSIKIWTRRGGLLESEAIQAFVGITFRTGSEALGVLFVNFPNPHYFTKDELEAITLFANQAAVAIENARLYEDQEQKLEESQELQKVGISLTATRDLKEVLDRVMQAALDLIKADNGQILFFDEKKDEFRTNALRSPGIGAPLEEYQTRVRQRTGLTYEIIKSRRPIRIPDVRQDPRVNEVAIQEGRGAMLGIPLIGREKPLGVIWLNWKRARDIPDRDIRLLTALASQASVAIENADLFEQLRAENEHRKTETQALQKIGISLTEPIELNAVLHLVMQAALELVQADEGSFLIYDENSQEFQHEALMCAGIGQPLQPYETKVRNRDGLAYDIIKEGKPIFVPDTEHEPRISPVAIAKGRRAMVGVPLLDHEGPVGVLWVNWKEPRQVSSREAILLTALASQATVAIKGVKRLAEIQKYSRIQEGLLEAAQGIAALKNSQEVLQTFTRSIRNTFQCDVVTLYIYDQENDRVNFPSYVSGELLKPDSMNKLGRVSKASIVKKMIEYGKPWFASDAAQDSFMVSDQYERRKEIPPFVQREGIVSSAGIPLIVGNTTVGVLFINYRTHHPFSQQEKDAVQVFATQVATVIQIAKIYEAVLRRSAQLQAVHEAGKVIAAASVGLGKQEILDRILEQAIESVTGVTGTKASAGTIQLFDPEQDALVFKSIYPAYEFRSFIDEMGTTIYLNPDKTKNDRIGVTGRAAITAEAQLVPDVSLNEDYLPYNSKTRSELAVPFIDNGKVIGVLDVESEALNAFDQVDKVSLEHLSDLAVVALNNSDRAEQLSRSNAVALMGAWGAEIVHDVNREVGYIRRAIYLLQQSRDLPPRMYHVFKEIDLSAQNLALPEIPLGTTKEETMLNAASASLDAIIRRTVEKYQAAHPLISWRYSPTNAKTTVAIHEKFLFSIVRHLFQNAAFAVMRSNDERIVTTRTHIDGSTAVVEVQDTGPGLRSELKSHLFRQPIPHEDGRKGRGLFLVGFIIAQHGGQIELINDPNSKGSCFRFWLPLSS